MTLKRSLLTLLMPVGLLAQSIESDVPLALNLPTTSTLQDWDIGLRFTHRFATPAQGNSKDAYGLDGYTFSGLGFDFGIKSIKGMNVQIYRTSDNKTFTFALQQQLVNGPAFRMCLVAERYDEVVKSQTTPANTAVGIVGGAFLVPMDLVMANGTFVLSAVPAYISATATYPQRLNESKGIFNVGLGARVYIGEKNAIFAEYYPKPSKLPDSFRAGGAIGYQYRTFKHRFTLMLTNVEGTTPNQVLGGDFAGGPRKPNEWAFGFNLVRIF